jgi:hypothetical protein
MAKRIALASTESPNFPIPQRYPGRTCRDWEAVPRGPGAEPGGGPVPNLVRARRRIWCRIWLLEPRR